MDENDLFGAHEPGVDFPAVRLVAFPYAGGNSRCYQKLGRKLPSFVQLVTHELPGHGLRMREPLRRSMPSLVDDVVERLAVGLAAESCQAQLLEPRYMA